MLSLLTRNSLRELQQSCLLHQCFSQKDHRTWLTEFCMDTSVAASRSLKGPKASNVCLTRFKYSEALFSGINPTLCSTNTVKDTLHWLKHKTLGSHKYGPIVRRKSWKTLNMLAKRVNEHQVLISRNLWGTALPKICSLENPPSPSKYETPKA